MTRTLFFDIGNVLVFFDPQIALRRLAGSSAYLPEQMAELLRRWPRIIDFECGRMSTESFFGEICSYLQLRGLSQAQFEEIWSQIFFDEMLVSPETLRSLRQRYRLVLVSNTNPMHFAVVQRKFPVLAEFDDAVLSFRVGAVKPAPQIFLEAIARAGCRPEETLFVDDIQQNIEAACSLGISGVRFESEAQLLREFSKHGIHVDDVTSHGGEVPR